MRYIIVFLLFWISPAFAEGLKTEDLGNRAPGAVGPAQGLTPEQMQLLMKSMPTSGGGMQGASGAASADDLQQLMQQLKELNGTIEERNKVLDQLMDETP